MGPRNAVSKAGQWVQKNSNKCSSSMAQNYKNIFFLLKIGVKNVENVTLRYFLYITGTYFLKSVTLSVTRYTFANTL